VFIGVLVIGFALTWALNGSGDVAGAGEPAPDFDVELLDGGTFSLADHITGDGRPLVLNLWASWCPPCREEIPDLSAFADAHPEIAVLGVAVEDRIEEARALAAELKPVYPLAFGSPGFEDSYPNFGLPVTYFLDTEGNVSRVFNGVLTEQTLEELTGT
jgi:cytochrome c biogenesis protein CcmG/thiol:disulfide interchange protein DsbE